MDYSYLQGGKKMREGQKMIPEIQVGGCLRIKDSISIKRLMLSGKVIEDMERSRYIQKIFIN